MTPTTQTSAEHPPMPFTPASQGRSGLNKSDPDHLVEQFQRLKPLERLAKYNIPEAIKGYSIVPVVSPRWNPDNTKRGRLLIIVESLDSADLRQNSLLKSLRYEYENKFGGPPRLGPERNTMIATMTNTVSRAWRQYQEYLGISELSQDVTLPAFDIAVANFNALRYFHTTGVERQNALVRCARRMEKIIADLKPTDVLIFGDTAASFFIPDDLPDTIPNKRGWVYPNGEVPGLRPGEAPHRFYVSHTLDLEPLYNQGDGEGDGELDASAPSDLLYFVTRNIANTFARRNLHSVGNINPKVHVVDTIAKFERMMELVKAYPGNKLIGLDLETASLEAYANTIYTIQIAFSAKAGFFLPVEHKDTPFTQDEITHIKAELREFLYTREPSLLKVFTGANIQFDLKVLQAQLDIPVVRHRIFEVTMAEMALDENIALFGRLSFRFRSENVKTSIGNLRNLACYYGSDQYYRMSFSKEHRMDYGRINVMTDAPAQFYAVCDASICVAIAEQQIDRARHIRISPDTTYERMFWRYVTYQGNATIHDISTMHRHGSHVNVRHMEKLADPKKSDLLAIMSETEKELRETDAVKETNRVLCQTAGAQTNDLFGSEVDLFDMTRGPGLKTLAFKVLGLKPIKLTDTGEPSLDKAFLAEFAPLHPEIELIQRWRAAEKLRGTYVVGWLRKTLEGGDSKNDHCLRAGFGFMIVSGRLNSRDPNFQQVPSRGKLAKKIKQMFEARGTRVHYSWDLNAAEVRIAAVLSGDTILADAFWKGYHLRQQLVTLTDPDEIAALRKRIAAEGDVHIINVRLFFGQDVDKNHPLRSAVKQVTFGVLYGKSPATLAKDLKGEARFRHRATRLELLARLKSIQAAKDAS